MATTTPTPAEAAAMEQVRTAIDAGDRLAIRGGGSKSGIGRATAAATLDMGALAGVVDYDPAELVLTVRPGTPLATIETMVAEHRQMLAFEPFDHGPIFGAPAGAATIGGVVAAGVAGSRRVSAGGVRDHLLGLRAVSGRGELFVAGARVVKNVTGYDLPKLAAGSWGRLFAMTELTLKVLPRPQASATRVIVGLDTPAAVRAMSAAMGSTADVACAAHCPAAYGHPSRTAIRIEGFAPSVVARGTMLDRLLAEYGRVEPAAASETIWQDLRTLAPLPADRAVWRVNVTPGRSAPLAAQLEARGAAWLMDWAGALLWVACDDPAAVRAAATQAGGHAALVRAPTELRDAVSAFHPLARGVAALEQRVRRAFDPAGVFETGRFDDADTFLS